MANKNLSIFTWIYFVATGGIKPSVFERDDVYEKLSYTASFTQKIF